MKKKDKTISIVFFFHFLAIFLLYILGNKSSERILKKKISETIYVLEQPIQIKKEPQKNIFLKKTKESPVISKKEISKKPIKEEKKKPVLKKKENICNKDKKGEKLSKDLFDRLTKDLSSFYESKEDNEIKKSENLKLPILSSIESVQIKDEKRVYGDFRQKLSDFFKSRLNLPEYGEVKIKLFVTEEGKKSKYAISYGVFLGYNFGILPSGRSDDELLEIVQAKLEQDAKEHAEYIAQKIKDCGLENHAFYLYLLPLNDAESEKKTIMKHVLDGDVDL